MAAYGADAVRFYFMAHLEFGKDGDFSETRFRDRVRLLQVTAGSLRCSHPLTC